MAGSVLPEQQPWVSSTLVISVHTKPSRCTEAADTPCCLSTEHLYQVFTSVDDCISGAVVCFSAVCTTEGCLVCICAVRGTAGAPDKQTDRLGRRLMCLLDRAGGSTPSSMGVAANQRERRLRVLMAPVGALHEIERWIKKMPCAVSMFPPSDGCSFHCKSCLGLPGWTMWGM